MINTQWTFGIAEILTRHQQVIITTNFLDCKISIETRKSRNSHLTEIVQSPSNGINSSTDKSQYYNYYCCNITAQCSIKTSKQVLPQDHQSTWPLLHCLAQPLTLLGIVDPHKRAISQLCYYAKCSRSRLNVMSIHRCPKNFGTLGGLLLGLGVWSNSKIRSSPRCITMQNLVTVVHMVWQYVRIQNLIPTGPYLWAVVTITG